MLTTVRYTDQHADRRDHAITVDTCDLEATLAMLRRNGAIIL